MDLAKIKKVDWQYLVNRNEALLFRSITDNSYRYFKKVTGISWRASHILRFGEGELYHSKKELDKLRSIFKKGGVDLFYDFRQHLLFYIRSLDKLVQRIEKINYSKLSKPQLVKLLKDYFQADLNVHNFLLPMPVADGVISQMILELLPKASAQKKQKWLSILIYPLKENEHVKEERSFYKLAFAYKNKKKNFDHLLKMHLKRFSWIGARGYWWDKAWTKEDIKNRLKSFLAQSQNPTKKFKHLDNIQKQRNKTSEKLLKELNIKKSSLLYKLIQLAKEFVYLRPWRTDIIYSFGYRAHHLFYEAAKRAGLKENDIVYLAFSEVIKMARTAKIP
ncbi:hypothetical protein KKF32_04175, partial [Patescibacteria group bacterium]|nr:hypothetical protein [Patescibacteria group bacterium]